MMFVAKGAAPRRSTRCASAAPAQTALHPARRGPLVSRNHHLCPHQRVRAQVVRGHRRFRHRIADSCNHRNARTRRSTSPGPGQGGPVAGPGQCGGHLADFCKNQLRPLGGRRQRRRGLRPGTGSKEIRARYQSCQAGSGQVGSQTRRSPGAQLETLEGFKDVRAPFDGTITQRHIDIGDLVTAGSTTNTSPLFAVSQSNLMRVFVDVPQAALPSIHVNMAAYAKARELGDHKFRGTVDRMASSLDLHSRTMRVEVLVPNGISLYPADFFFHPPSLLHPGMYLQVTFQTNRTDPPLRIPPAAAGVRAAWAAGGRGGRRRADSASGRSSLTATWAMPSKSQSGLKRWRNRRIERRQPGGGRRASRCPRDRRVAAAERQCSGPRRDGVGRWQRSDCGTAKGWFGYREPHPTCIIGNQRCALTENSPTLLAARFPISQRADAQGKMIVRTPDGDSVTSIVRERIKACDIWIPHRIFPLPLLLLLARPADRLHVSARITSRRANRCRGAFDGSLTAASTAAATQPAGAASPGRSI